MSDQNSKLNLVCSRCSAVNRVAPSKLDDRPICGNCATLLLPRRPIELDDACFDKFVSRTSLPIVVDFWAPWCGPCRAMAPAFSEAAEELSPDVILAKLDTESSPQTASKFAVSSIPTLVYFRNGQEADRQSGAVSRQQIIDWITKARIG